MPSWQRNHKRVSPRGKCDDSIPDFVGLCKTDVIQVVVKPFDLLGQWHLEEANLDLGLLLATQCQ